MCLSSGCGAVAKNEEVYLQAYHAVAEARHGIGAYFRFYDTERRHQGVNRLTPVMCMRAP